MLLILFTVILIRYNILFKVTINGEAIGYVTNKYEIEEEINNYIENKRKYFYNIHSIWNNNR